MQFLRLVGTLILLITLSVVGFSQEVQKQKSTEKVRIDGEIYYIHSVKKGETIYSLTKVYNISEDELLRTNPQLSDGLKDGQVLRIPEKTQQPVTQPKANRTLEGVAEHEVQRKETLFSISRLYNISVSDIKKANPTIDDNIRKGQILYIPVSQQNNAALQANAQHVPIKHAEEGDNMAGEHVYHSVKKSETLYSIVQQYAADEAAIRSLNRDAFKDGKLMEGAVLRIPKYETKKLSSGALVLFPGNTSRPNNIHPPVNNYTYKSTDVFNVTFLLPLTSNSGDIAALPETHTSKGRKQNSYLEFYEGALLAIDSLKRTGLSVNISTFDISTSKSLETALQNSNVQQAQLIIAPIQNELAKQLADYAQHRQIPVVLPSSTLSDSIITYNPYLVQLRPPKLAVKDKLLANVCQANRNIILVHHAGTDTTLLHAYSNILKARGCTYSTVSSTITRSRSDLQAKLSTTNENHVIVASSNDEAFVINILESLNVFLSKNKIKSNVYGSSDWRQMSMNSLQLTYLYNLNLRIAQSFYVDYNDIDTNEFIAKYRFYYKGEPSNYAFYGYDACLYFLDCLRTYGSNFTPFLPTHEESMLQSRFLFKQIGNGGMKNEGVFLLEYQPNLDIIKK